MRIRLASKLMTWNPKSSLYLFIPLSYSILLKKLYSKGNLSLRCCQIQHYVIMPQAVNTLKVILVHLVLNEKQLYKMVEDFYKWFLSITLKTFWNSEFWLDLVMSHQKTLSVIMLVYLLEETWTLVLMWIQCNLFRVSEILNVRL
jgi:hypothetical protein